MSLRDSVTAGLARQLSQPSGLRGRLVGALLNRGNRAAVTAAADALNLCPGAVAADLGFGGGLGLDLLLARVGASGQVHGVEVSETMVSRAGHRFRPHVAAGRLHLHSGSMTRLPLADNCLDGVITVNTIYFLPDLDLGLMELARVLRNPGRAVIGLGDPRAMAKMAVTAYGFQLRPVSEVVDSLLSVGLTVEEDRRVGDGEDALHLLVATPTAPAAA